MIFYGIYCQLPTLQLTNMKGEFDMGEQELIQYLLIVLM